ncbi:hypothetical protein AK812_SmicGene18787 [Symbiodinium microadriaticum]|uniref:Uncharacterized protein n=1 Tax=Symbiodinium microadriaticum TaxID=2951 RepID=A0A1Q9DU96_SYMMI|nr:hypothetical protein AK812_SmicGene18787 [Symbiodinium microadriaticum]
MGFHVECTEGGLPPPGFTVSASNLRPLQRVAVQRPTSFQAGADEAAKAEEEPAKDPFPEDCKVELQADEPRSCEQRWVNWCQDECRAHYGDNKKAVYKGHDKWLCYNEFL